jgi:hypothetical protein
MGAIGLVLLYLPVLAVIAVALGSAGSRPEGSWARYGAAVWLISVVVSSITLITLFSVSGLVVVAAACAAACQGLDGEGRPGRDPADGPR